MYPSGAAGNRGHIAWTNSTAGGFRNRTLLRVFANENEHILVGSSAVGVSNGDIQIFNPSTVGGAVANETIPGTADFTCTTDQPGQGFISTRAEELAGPESVSGTGNTAGYTPCFYQAPTTGIYFIAMYGPSGPNSNTSASGGVESNIEAISTATSQNTGISAWDVTVRSSDVNSTTDNTGRLHTFFISKNMGNNGRQLHSNLYPITVDGYRYEVDLRGIDPFGFRIFGNQLGNLDSDGASPLYRDVLGDDGQIANPVGNTSSAPPQYPLFFNSLDPSILPFLPVYDPFTGAQTATGFPASPTLPVVTDPAYTGNISGNTSLLGNGGTFSFNSNLAGVFQIVLSRDGVDFDPGNPQNRSIRGYMNTAGIQSIAWDGLDNAGDAFPVGTFNFRIETHGGEYHFPISDAENNFFGGPTYTLLNATNPLGNNTAFYDHRGYRTVGGTIVADGDATDGDPFDDALCGTNPPSPPNTDLILGADSSLSTFNVFGQASGGNTNTQCTGAFGDTKTLDLWTYLPSSPASSDVVIIAVDTFDYGDAPDTYGTDATAGNSTNSSDPIGARHTITSGIHLGTNAPDGEADAETPLDGTGDGADEDGITLSTLTAEEVTYKIPQANISATGTGTLHAWVDFNKDGTFESDEYSTVDITSGVPEGDLDWAGITAGAAGDTYARFRFTSDTSITASTPGGTASDGEVEDYQLTIAASSTGPRFACNTIAYNVIGTPSEFNAIDPSTLAITPLSTPTSPNFDPAIRLNGIAFNPLDNYIYALVSDPQGQAGYAAHDFIRISSNGTLENLGPATAVGNPSVVMTGTTSSTDNGTMDGSGNYYNLENGTTLRKVSIGSTPTANSLTFEEITVTGLGTKPWDLSFNPVDGFLYGIGSGTLYRIDPDSGTATAVTTTGETLPVTAGGAWSNSAGVSYFYKNAGGGNNNLFAVDLTQSPAVVTIVGAVPQDGQFDATSCTPPELTKDENLDTVSPGDTVTYTYTLFNGFGTDIFVNFDDTLTDSNITYNAGTLSTTSPGGGSVTQFDSTQLSIGNILVPTGVGGGINSVTFTVDVTVSNSALDGTVVTNQATTTFGASTILSDDPETGTIDDPTTFNVVVSSDPNLLLVKRITAINRGEADEQLFDTSYVDGGTNSDADNETNWPGGTATATVGSGTVESYIAGIINGADSGITINPGETLEYTIPFLSNGDIAAQNVLVCDRIPTNTSFLSTAFDSSTPASPGSGNRGILIDFNGSQVALTNANDGDEIPDSGGDNGVGGYYFAPGVDPTTVFPDISCDGTSDNGTIVVDLSDIPNATGDGTPANSYGFIRFRVTVD